MEGNSRRLENSELSVDVRVCPLDELVSATGDTHTLTDFGRELLAIRNSAMDSYDEHTFANQIAAFGPDNTGVFVAHSKDTGEPLGFMHMLVRKWGSDSEGQVLTYYRTLRTYRANFGESCENIPASILLAREILRFEQEKDKYPDVLFDSYTQFKEKIFPWFSTYEFPQTVEAFFSTLLEANRGLNREDEYTYRNVLYVGDVCVDAHFQGRKIASQMATKVFEVMNPLIAIAQTRNRIVTDMHRNLPDGYSAFVAGIPLHGKVNTTIDDLTTALLCFNSTSAIVPAFYLLNSSKQENTSYDQFILSDPNVFFSALKLSNILSVPLSQIRKAIIFQHAMASLTTPITPPPENDILYPVFDIMTQLENMSQMRNRHALPCIIVEDSLLNAGNNLGFPKRLLTYEENNMLQVALNTNDIKFIKNLFPQFF